MKRSLAVLLPGLHRVHRGAEAAFEALSQEIGRRDDWEVTLFGSGAPREGTSYEYHQISCTPRERFENWQRIPPMRSETVWEELSFVRHLSRNYDSGIYDVTLTCSYPFLNWFLRYKRNRRLRKPRHIFVTQNGDWPCHRTNSEFRWFGCDGLVCINPDYYAAHRNTYSCFLIPNAVDVQQFCPGPSDGSEFNLPVDQPIVLMVSALIPSKRVLEGIRVAARLPQIRLVIAGDGPLRTQVDDLGKQLLPGRFHRFSVDAKRMPQLYRSVNAVLHMSMDEPFGNVFTESLATGLPVVAHDRPTSRWILEDTAYLANAQDIDEVASSLSLALSECDDRKRLQRIQLAQSRFAWPSVADQYCEAIRSILED